jgi:hypothetical protein
MAIRADTAGNIDIAGRIEGGARVAPWPVAITRIPRATRAAAQLLSLIVLAGVLVGLTFVAMLGGVYYTILSLAH